jgi:hypothetical protein
VLQVIYAVTDDTLPLYVGQQMDVFIDDIVAREKNVARPAPALDPIQATQRRAHPVAEVPLQPE